MDADGGEHRVLMSMYSIYSKNADEEMNRFGFGVEADIIGDELPRCSLNVKNEFFPFHKYQCELRCSIDNKLVVVRLF